MLAVKILCQMVVCSTTLVALGLMVEAQTTTAPVKLNRDGFGLEITPLSEAEQQRRVERFNSVNRNPNVKFTSANWRFRLLKKSETSDTQELVWERSFFVTQTNSLSLKEEDYDLNTPRIGDLPTPAPRILDALLDSSIRTSVVAYQRDRAVWADIVALTNGVPVQRLQFPANRICDQRYLDPPSAAVSAEITKAKAPGTYAIHLKFTSGYSTNYVFDGTKWQPGPAQP